MGLLIMGRQRWILHFNLAMIVFLFFFSIRVDAKNLNKKNKYNNIHLRGLKKIPTEESTSRNLPVALLQPKKNSNRRIQQENDEINNDKTNYSSNYYEYKKEIKNGGYSNKHKNTNN